MKPRTKKHNENRFWASLFDFSFSKFVTIRVFKLIYWINIILAGLLAILTIAGSLRESLWLGILALIVAPLLFLVYILLLRIALEAIAVIFHIGDHVKNIAGQLEHKTKRIDNYEVSDTEEK